MSNAENEPGYLDGKIALVTGVTSGLGKAIAQVFAARGATVIGVARRQEEGDRLVDQIREAGGICEFIAADVSIEEEGRRVVAQTLSRHGRLDILINNAAITGEVKAIEDLPTEEWDRVFNLNLRSVFILTKEALPAMKASGKGVILNVASIAGKIAGASQSAYNASKAGLIQFTNSIAVETAGSEIRANSIIIGAVPSAMSYGTGAAIGQSVRGADWSPSPEYRTRWGMRANPSKKVARSLSLLCMDDADTITGATIAIDGGVTAGLLGSQMNQLVCAQLLPED